MTESQGTRRLQGRPARTARVITEGDYPAIYAKWLRGATVASIARDFEVDWHTASHHLQRCRTLMKATLIRDRNEVIDELTMIRSLAYECFDKSKRPLTHDEVARELAKVADEKNLDSEMVGRIVKQTTKMTIRDGDATWLTVALAAIDMENKLCGHYEAGKREGSKPVGKGGYRAAGRSPAETHKAMMDRVTELLAQRRAALCTQEN